MTKTRWWMTLGLAAGMVLSVGTMMLVAGTVPFWWPVQPVAGCIVVPVAGGAALAIWWEAHRLFAAWSAEAAPARREPRVHAPRIISDSEVVTVPHDVEDTARDLMTALDMARDAIDGVRLAGQDVTRVSLRVATKMGDMALERRRLYSIQSRYDALQRMANEDLPAAPVELRDILDEITLSDHVHHGPDAPADTSADTPADTRTPAQHAAADDITRLMTGEDDPPPAHVADLWASGKTRRSQVADTDHGDAITHDLSRLAHIARQPS